MSDQNSVSTAEQTVDATVEQTAVEYPKIAKLLAQLAAAIEREASSNLPPETVARIAQIDAALAGFAALDDSLEFVKTARAAANVERENLMISALAATIADVHTTLADDFAAVMPEHKCPVVETKTARVSAGRSATTAEDNIILSADGAEYRKRAIGKHDALTEMSDDAACMRLNCRFSEILSADAPKLSGYRMNMNKAIQSMTSEAIEEHRACMHAAALRTFEISDLAVTAIVFVPSGR